MRNIKAVRRIRSKVSGTSTRPRLCVNISLKNVRAQIIDDAQGKTLLSISTESEKSLIDKSLTEKASWLGDKVATSAKKQGVSSVVFDRGGKIYHGRIKSFAESARKSGLEF